VYKIRHNPLKKIRTMKRINLLIIALVFAPVFSFAQLAINTTGQEATSSAMLEIASNDKGILIPKMVIADISSNTSPVNLPADGLMIYNTGYDIGGLNEVSEGFYYWSALRWNQMTNDLTPFSVTQLSQLYETAELYENNDFSSPTNIGMPNSASFYGWISATEGETFGSTTTNTSSSVADQIIVGEAGLYDVALNISFGGSQNAQIRGIVFKTPNGGSAAVTRIQLLRKLGSQGDLGSASCKGLIRLEAGDALEVRFNSTSDGEDIDIYTVNFIVNKVGE